MSYQVTERKSRSCGGVCSCPGNMGAEARQAELQKMGTNMRSRRLLIIVTGKIFGDYECEDKNTVRSSRMKSLPSMTTTWSLTTIDTWLKAFDRVAKACLGLTGKPRDPVPV